MQNTELLNQLDSAFDMRKAVTKHRDVLESVLWASFCFSR